MHYTTIFLIIAIIVLWQIYSFLDNYRNLVLFRNIFPQTKSKIELLNDFELITDVNNKNVSGIKTLHKNNILDIIVFSLNNYLYNNKSAVSDFHILKDIVDRNCDAKEEEIHSQIPVPLYLGLVGTMMGILVGVGFLVFGGGLNELLNSGNGVITDGVSQLKNEATINYTESGAEGIESLLGGVALAMTSSILGILLTTWGSHLAKKAKVEVEKGKNSFLSWIQSNLLPNLSTNINSALVGMTKNLSRFNSTFSQNTKDLGDTLTKINESYDIQANLIQEIKRLKIDDIASANIEVYNQLKNSTHEIGIFARYLNNVNEYLTNVQSLNQKLDDYERRTQIIENAGRFFLKNEKWLAENFDSANLEVTAAITRFGNNTNGYLQNLQESLNGQIMRFQEIMETQQDNLEESLKNTTKIVEDSFNKTQHTFDNSIAEQQKLLKEKIQEITKVTDEIKNLTHIKDGIKDFKEAINKQNSKIDDLANEIRALAKAKIEGGTIKQEISIPKWIKTSILIGGGLFVTTCLIYIVPQLVEWITKLINWVL